MRDPLGSLTDEVVDTVAQLFGALDAGQRRQVLGYVIDGSSASPETQRVGDDLTRIVGTVTDEVAEALELIGTGWGEPLPDGLLADLSSAIADFAGDVPREPTIEAILLALTADLDGGGQLLEIADVVRALHGASATTTARQRLEILVVVVRDLVQAAERDRRTDTEWLDAARFVAGLVGDSLRTAEGELRAVGDPADMVARALVGELVDARLIPSTEDDESLAFV